MNSRTGVAVSRATPVQQMVMGTFAKSSRKKGGV
jgi:hypothetical protein